MSTLRLFCAGACACTGSDSGTGCATDADVHASGQGVRVNRAGAFVNGNGADEGESDEIKILGDVTIRAVGNVNDVVRFEEDVRVSAADDFAVVDHGDPWIVEGAANDPDMSEVCVFNRSACFGDGGNK